MSSNQIPGYTYGTSAISKSPVSLEDLQNLKMTVMFTEEDKQYLRMAGEVLSEQLEAVLDLWYDFVGSHPHLAYYFWFRFAKQRLHWTLPNLSTAKQAERWSDLMPLLSWQLWLARDLVSDNPLPWQKPQTHLTPGRVAQSMAALFTQLGTPAQVPKRRGKSPGWTQGQSRTSRVRAPIVKKRYSKRKKQSQVST